MKLRSGYDRTKNPVESEYRYMTVGEAKQLKGGERIPFKSNDGTQRELTINGKPQTWKRKFPGVEVPVKYGMYEFFRIDCRHSSDEDDMDFLLVAL